MSISRSQARAPRAVTLVVALLAVALAPSGAAAAAPAAKAPARITFGIEPGVVTGIDARPFFSFGVTPGATLRDHVAVLNYSKAPVTLAVYATDADNAADGSFALPPAATRPTEVGTWIRLGLSGPTVRVPARTAKAPGRVLVPLTVVVPSNATPGDHAGGVVASLNTVSKEATGANIRLNQRVATRVYVRVAGTLAPRLSVVDLHASYRGVVNPVGRGDVRVSYTVRNTGNVKLAARQAVVVGGLFGTVHAHGPADVPLLLPGGSETVTAAVSGVLPTFVRTATVTLTPLKPTGDADPSVPNVTARTHFWAVPWTLLAIIALLIATGWYLRRRSVRRSSAPPAAAVASHRAAEVSS